MSGGGNQCPHHSWPKAIGHLKQLNMIPHRFHVDLPQDLIDAVIKLKTTQPFLK